MAQFRINIVSIIILDRTKECPRNNIYGFEGDSSISHYFIITDRTHVLRNIAAQHSLYVKRVGEASWDGALFSQRKLLMIDWCSTMKGWESKCFSIPHFVIQILLSLWLAEGDMDEMTERQRLHSGGSGMVERQYLDDPEAKVSHTDCGCWNSRIIWNIWIDEPSFDTFISKDSTEV